MVTSGSTLDSIEEMFPNTVRERREQYSQKDAYKTVAWVYACSNLLSDCMSGVEFYFYRGKGDTRKDRNVIDMIPAVNRNGKRVSREPIVEALSPVKENEIPTVAEMLRLQVIHECQYGESFIRPTKIVRKAPTGFELLHPLKLTPKKDQKTGELRHWEHKRGGNQPKEIIKPDGLVQWKRPNPYDSIRGLSPLAAARLAIEQDYNMATWNAGFFQAGVRNPIALLLKQTFNENQRKEYISRMQRNFTGFVRGQLPLLVEGGVDLKVLSNTIKDLDFVEGKSLTREELCAIFNVPPAQVGIFRYANYANCVTADTKVTLKDGTTTEVINITAGDEILTMGAEGIVTSVVNNMWKAGRKDIYKISTGSRSVRCSEEHKFYQLTAGVNPANPRKKVWANAKDLKVGDYIAVVTETHDNNQNEAKMGTEAMHQLGLYLGDGNVSSSRGYKTGLTYAIPDTDPDKNEYIAEASRVWEANVCRDKYTYRVCSVSAAKRLEAYGFGGLCKEKRIPRWVFDCTRQEKEALLKGIFDSDGHYDKNGRVQVRLANKELLEDIRDLCISIGYHVNNICTQERETNFGHQIIHGVVVSFNEGTHRAFPNHPLSEGMAWERIRSIELQDPEETYDIEVEGTHNFFANHVVVHNSKEQRSILYLNNLKPKMTYYRDVFQMSILNRWFPGVKCDFYWESVDAFRQDPLEQARSLLQLSMAAEKLFLMGYDEEQVAIILKNPDFNQSRTIIGGSAFEDQEEEVDVATVETDEEEVAVAASAPVMVRAKDLIKIKADEKYLEKYARSTTNKLSRHVGRLDSFIRSYSATLAKNLTRKGSLASQFWGGQWKEGLTPIMSEVFKLGVESVFADVQKPFPKSIPDSPEYAAKLKSLLGLVPLLAASVDQNGAKKASEAVSSLPSTICANRTAHRFYSIGRFHGFILTQTEKHVWCWGGDALHQDLHGKEASLGDPFVGEEIYPGAKRLDAVCTCVTRPTIVRREKKVITMTGSAS